MVVFTSISCEIEIQQCEDGQFDEGMTDNTLKYEKEG